MKALMLSVTKAISSSYEARVFAYGLSALNNTKRMSTTTQEMLSREAVAAMRINYKSHGLKMEDLERKEPFTMFDKWFKMAKDCTLIKEPNAMSLATASKDGRPSVRVVLLKGYDHNGFRFFTNYTSRKGQEIESNPNIAIMFYWEPLERQVRIEGQVRKLSEEESTNYFCLRPRASQLGALASNQSKPVPDKEFLEKRYAELEKRYENTEIPKPDNWGGYQLMPEVFEFWCGGKGRMHDRVVFKKQSMKSSDQHNELIKNGDDGWQYEFIAP